MHQRLLGQTEQAGLDYTVFTKGSLGGELPAGVTDRETGEAILGIAVKLTAAVDTIQRGRRCDAPIQCMLGGSGGEGQSWGWEGGIGFAR